MLKEEDKGSTERRSKREKPLLQGENTLVLTGPCGLLGYVEEIAMNFVL